MPPDLARLSELDAGYGLIAGGMLYLFFPGNLQNNSNNINLFIADGRSGQSILSGGKSGKSWAKYFIGHERFQVQPGIFGDLCI